LYRATQALENVPGVGTGVGVSAGVLVGVAVVAGVATGVGDGVRVGVGLVSPEPHAMEKATSDMLKSASITNLIFYLL